MNPATTTGGDRAPDVPLPWGGAAQRRGHKRTGSWATDQASQCLGADHGGTADGPRCWQDCCFQPQQTDAVGNGPFSVAVGDLNGDGKLDLVTANNPSNTVSVLLGQGDGTFQPQRTAAVGTKPDAVALGDLNHDGSLDLVTANYASADVSVLLGRGDGTFQRQTTAAVRADPSSVVVKDLNGDGRLDIVAANSLSNNVSILLGQGDGTFQPQQTAAVGSRPYSVAAGDLNHDGTPDLVTANNASSTASVLLGDTTTCLTTSPTSGSPTTPLTLSGTHFGAHERVMLYWDSSATPPLTRTTTDASGAFLATATHATGRLWDTPPDRRGADQRPLGDHHVPGHAPRHPGAVRRRLGHSRHSLGRRLWGRRDGHLVLGHATQWPGHRDDDNERDGTVHGATAISFTVPAVPPGNYQVCGQGQSTLAQRCATFSVTG